MSNKIVLNLARMAQVVIMLPVLVISASFAADVNQIQDEIREFDFLLSTKTLALEPSLSLTDHWIFLEYFLET